MKTRLLSTGAALTLLIACVIPPRPVVPPVPVPPPVPPAPRLVTFDIIACSRPPVNGTCERPLAGASVRVSNHDTPTIEIEQRTNGDGYTVFSFVDVTGDASIYVTADGYLPYDSGTVHPRELVGRHNIIALNPIAAPEPTVAQLLDLQGDLMIWAPALALRCDPATGEDPRARIRCVGDNGAVPRGLIAGYVWGLTVTRYGPADREVFYQAARAAGHTHYQVAVSSCHVGDGYHGLYPETPESCATAAARTNTVLRELGDHHLIRMCVGVSPDDPVLAGLDHRLCDVVADDWDNSMQKDCRLDVLAREFPDRPIFLWRLAGTTAFEPDACSPTPFPVSNAAWLRAAQQRVPAFVAVFHEVNVPEGIDAAIADLTAAHNDGYRDVLEALGESDTYWKLWQGLPDAAQRALNDEVMRRLPWLRGCFSGCTTHAPPVDAPPATGTLTDGDAFDLREADVIDSPAGFASWRIGTTITRLDVLPSGFHFVFDAANRWPNVTPPGWTGALQYTVGVAFRIEGRWRVSTQIQAWRGLGDVNGVGVGGPVTQPVQFPKNWFYDQRGGRMAGYSPSVGELIGVVLCEGNCRDVPDGSQSPLRERSNVVVVPYPGPAGASYRR